jgi:hypothetical protein
VHQSSRVKSGDSFATIQSESPPPYLGWKAPGVVGMSGDLVVLVITTLP